MHANNHYTRWELLGVKEIMLRSKKSSDKRFLLVEEARRLYQREGIETRLYTGELWGYPSCHPLGVQAHKYLSCFFFFFFMSTLRF